MDNKKTGYIEGYYSLPDDALSFINEDLGLGLGLSDMKFIRDVVSAEKTKVTVTSLYLFAELLKTSVNLRDADLFGGIRSTDAAATEMFGSLASRYAKASGNRDSVPVIALAEYAASGAVAGKEEYLISDAALPTASLSRLSAGRSLVLKGRSRSFYVTASGAVPGTSFSGDAALLLYPETQSSVASFTEKLPGIIRQLSSSFYPFGCISLTEKGLIRDLADYVSGAELLPQSIADAAGCKPYPELLAKSFAPGVVVFASSVDADAVSSECSRAGISSRIIALNCGRGKIFHSGGFADGLFISSSAVKNLRYCRYIDSKSEYAPSDLSEEITVCSSERFGMRALKVIEPSFEFLSAFSDVHSRTGIIGEIDPLSPGAVPMILTLDAWHRESGITTEFCRFLIGNQNSLTLVFEDPASCPSTDCIPNFASKAVYPETRSDYTSASETECRNTGKEQGEKTMAENEFEKLPGRGKIYGSIAELCGSTPLLRVHPELPATLLYKLESFNPAGSAKDRVALNMLRCAANTGKLLPGGTVIEPTSGNTGIGLAAYGVTMGYKVIIVMPDSMSKERIDLIKAYGAEIVLTPGSEGMKGAINKAEELRDATPGAIIASQFDNPANPAAHYMSTGPEIWKDTRGEVDIIVAGIGTGGTLCGTAAYLKEKKPSVTAVGCEPASSPLITKGTAGPHKIQGIGANFIPGNFNEAIVDRIADINDGDAIDETVRIARETGFLVGISSGCAAFEARRLASLPENAGKTIVAILPDTGEHYISTGIFDN